MEYTKGTVGRVFTVRVDHGEDLLLELAKLAEQENIEAATFVLLGALAEGALVAGPKENRRPPDPIRIGFDTVHEILGIGDIFLEAGKPKIHLHAGGGRENDVKLGCLRGKSKVFMVVEVFIFELTGLSAKRVLDREQGFSPVKFGK